MDGMPEKRGTGNFIIRKDIMSMFIKAIWNILHVDLAVIG